MNWATIINVAKKFALAALPGIVKMLVDWLNERKAKDA